MSNWHSRLGHSSRLFFQRIARQIGHFCLPQTCLLCSVSLGQQAEALCTSCAEGLPLLDREVCPVCALPTPQGLTCGNCIKSPPHFDATSAHYRYAYPLDGLLQNFKYGHKLIIGAVLAELIIKQRTHSPNTSRPHFDAVIAVPATPQHLRERGFNPAMELARPLAASINTPLHSMACTRPRNGPAQASLPWKDRHKNIRGAFECKADLSGQRILVIDDVMTTGATLNEFARTLKRHGAVYVENLVIARAIKNEN